RARGAPRDRSPGRGEAEGRVELGRRVRARLFVLPGRARDRDDPALEGVVDELGLRMEAQLAHEVRAVRLGRAGADEQPLRDLGVAVAFRGELQDLALARGQRI